ncbi:MAG: replication initiation protein, partial [Thermoplasmatales archaeon]
SMNVNEIKLFIALVSLIKKDDEDFKEYSITVDELAKLFNIKDRTGIYDDVKRIAGSLVARTIFIENKEKSQWERYPIFSKMEYKDGILFAKFNTEISLFLLKLSENFTQFKLAEFKPFTSKYSIRIYELLKQYRKIGERTFDIEDLRSKIGIEKGELKKIIDFKRYVINVAQRELANTPMDFDYQMIKTGRKFTKIKFTLKHKFDDDTELVEEKLQSPDETFSKALEEVYALIPPEKITDSLKQIIETYYASKGLEYVKSAIQYVNEQQPKNYLAYLKSALENHYAEVFEKDKEEEQKRLAEQKRRERIKDLKDKRDKVIYKRDLEIEKLAKSIFESLPENVKDQITQFAKASILKENPNEDMNSTDRIFMAKLDFHIQDMVKSLYQDKFKEIRDKFDKEIAALEEEIKSI